MNITEEIFHSVLQKLIILTLGLLTFSVVLTSCHTPESCSAYNEIEIVDQPVD